MNKAKTSIIFLSLLTFTISLAQPFQAGTNGVVVSSSDIACDIGINIMQKGGNAIDATVAVGFALAVCWPEAGNIGGGGFMLIRFPDGSTTAIDFREKAPAAAERNMYLDQQGNPIPHLSRIGPLAAGVPGAVAGYHLIWSKYGRLPWKALLRPAIKLAQQGILVTYYIQHGLAQKRSVMQQYPSSMQMFFPNGAIPQIGDTLQFPALANTLRTIADRGALEFYQGEIAARLAQSVQSAGGIISYADLMNYQAQERTPIRFSYRGYDIFSMPPPSSGGICLAQILKIVENFKLHAYGFQALKTVQVMVEAERYAYANRAHYLGDPDFVSIPADYLIGDSLTTHLANQIDFEKAGSSVEFDHVPAPESEQTTHFSIVDKNGMAVAVTTTLNSSYGSCFVAGETGILLNNEMDDFSLKPGFPNMYGLVGANANAIESGKRMLSSMSPTIICRNDSLFWLMGTPGGATIITTIAQVLVNLIDFDMSLRNAIIAPRFHHQWLPDKIYLEENFFSPALITKLENKGYTVGIRNSIGDVNAIQVNHQEKCYLGVPDWRRQSAVRAY